LAGLSLNNGKLVHKSKYRLGNHRLIQLADLNQQIFSKTNIGCVLMIIGMFGEL